MTTSSPIGFKLDSKSICPVSFSISEILSNLLGKCSGKLRHQQLGWDPYCIETHGILAVPQRKHLRRGWMPAVAGFSLGRFKCCGPAFNVRATHRPGVFLFMGTHIQWVKLLSSCGSRLCRELHPIPESSTGPHWIICSYVQHTLFLLFSRCRSQLS